MSTLFGGILDGINQDKGQIYGLINNAVSYGQSKKQQKRAFEYAAMLQQQAYNLSQQYLKESYSNARQGLETAGFNPILAATSGTPSSPSFSGSPVNAYAPTDIASGASSYAQGSLNMNTKLLQNAQIKNTNAQTENIEQDTENKAVQKGILEADKRIKDYETDMKKFDRDTQEYKFANTMMNMWSQTKYNLENAAFVSYNAESQRIMSNASQVNAAAASKNAETNRGMSDTGFKFGPFGSNVKHYVPENFRLYNNKTTSNSNIRSRGYNNYSYRNYQ